MLRQLLKLRYLAVIVTVFLLIDAIGAIGWAVYKSIEAYQQIFENDPATRPLLNILKSIDIFLFGLVFLIFGLGLSRIFLYYTKADPKLPNWLRIDSLSELAVLLWETIITAFIIYFTTTIAQVRDAEFKWTILVMPTSILMLTVCLVIFKRYVADPEKKNHERHNENTKNDPVSNEVTSGIS
jgi:uncharacterized membrane protein YqhA